MGCQSKAALIVGVGFINFVPEAHILEMLIRQEMTEEEMEEETAAALERADILHWALKQATLDMAYLDTFKLTEFPNLRKIYTEKYEVLKEDASKTPNKFEILIPREGTVPLWNIHWTNKRFASGQVSQIVAAVNTQSLDVLLDCREIDITGLTKIPSTILWEMFTEFAQTATTFGTLGMTRITLPTYRTAQGRQLLRNCRIVLQKYATA